ncbi:MAG: thioredoxin family protein, partial [Planctomycetota bacterium]|nr:thioredoxin family protein [Planctomycetota bacterium]
TLPSLAGGLALLAILLTGAGCQSAGALATNDPAPLQTLVGQKDKPVLVLFYKQGCASCLALMPTIDKLAQEYDGRVTVGQFMILNFVFGVTSQDVKDRYDVVLVPHVVLMVNGKEKARWIMEYNIDAYRKVLDEATQPTRQAARTP